MGFKEGEQLIIVHYGELWLKGRNRSYYINKLKKNIHDRLLGEKYGMEQQYDRLVFKLPKGSNPERIKKKLSKVFGISAIEVVYATKPELAAINKLAKKHLAKMKGKKTIKIDAHRSYKGTSFNSLDIIHKIADTARKMKFEVSNHNYEGLILVNLTKDAAFVCTERTKALRGLPLGTSGRGIVLLSGGIDSPVAAWYAMKRGVEPIYVHVHAFPDNKEVLKSKMKNLVNILKEYSPSGRMYAVPSHIFQVNLTRSGKYELVLLKAFMMRLAERIAEKESANLIFTGESLGQVASQTPSNIYAEGSGVNVPILRPLIGFDKEEIIKVAREIGTYDISVKEYRDVCSINSRNPSTQIDIKRMNILVKEWKIDDLVKRSLAASSVFEI